MSSSPHLPLLPVHGGPDSGPPISHDFSTNANPLGPPLGLVRAVQAADRSRYPDPQYLTLRAQLAAGEGLSAPEQLLVASGGAEAIRRLTLAALLARGCREVWVPRPGFGDYALAAQALDLAVQGYGPDELPRPSGPALVWACEPCNPTGGSLDGAALQALAELPGVTLVVDRAYEALRLDGEAPLIPAQAWQLVCPNKALGLTGVRAAYVRAPEPDALWARMLSLAPSWVLSAEGVALLQHWHDPATALWLAHSREQLRLWRRQLRQALAARGWEQGESVTNFWLARPPEPLDDGRLRAAGLKLRDASSLGAPGAWRIAALPGTAQQALLKEMDR